MTLDFPGADKLVASLDAAVALADRHLPGGHRVRLQVGRQALPPRAVEPAGQRVVGAAEARGVDQSAQRLRALTKQVLNHVAPLKMNAFVVQTVETLLDAIGIP